MSQELKACPWCSDGGSPVAYSRVVERIVGQPKTIWGTACEACHCDGPGGDDPTSREATIVAWNERPDLSALISKWKTGAVDPTDDPREILAKCISDLERALEGK